MERSSPDASSLIGEQKRSGSPMQQQQDGWPYPDVPSNKEEFLRDLQTFHDERETTLDKEPRVSNKQIDLWRLFRTVQERGGYDSVSAEKLAWRKLAQELGLSQPAYAFQVKSIFYKNLAAYAIKKVYHKEPPPKEILEDLTARGGELLTRTKENFDPPSRNMFQENPADGLVEEAHDTPKLEKTDTEEASNTGRDRRNLRQAPAPRQIFTPDVSSSRQARSAGATPLTSQPTPTLTNGTVSSASGRFDRDTYEGIAALPQSLRTVSTPSNQPLVYRNRYNLVRAQHRASQRNEQSLPKGFIPAGSGSSGAMGTQLYTRVLHSLRSPVDDDKRWAIHHLVMISDVMGGRFRLDAFPGMAEGLIELVLRVSSLYYDVRWRISYDDTPSEDVEVLDGIRGTDVISRLRRLRPLVDLGNVQTKEFTSTLALCNEAAHVLRNLALTESNAFYLVSMLPAKDLLGIVLNLPSRPELSEIKFHALEMAEQMVKFLPLSPTDSVYIGLLRFVRDGQDRGSILVSLRAICSIAYHSHQANSLPPVEVGVLSQLFNWLLLEDDELVHACLEYFYQYTGISANVAVMLDGASGMEFPLPSFVEHLSRLLKHNAKEEFVRREIAPAITATKPAERPALPEALMKELLPISEPTRASRWLKCMFEEDPKEDITQLELWQSYQNTFGQQVEGTPTVPLMSAADFIKNVSTTLPGATARIVRTANTNSNPRFIMSGIRYKTDPTDPAGHMFAKCLWTENAADGLCGSYQRPGLPMLDHVLKLHLGLPDHKTLSSMTAEDASAIKTSVTDCKWFSCAHFKRCRPGHSPGSVELTRHINLHMGSNKPSDKHERRRPIIKEAAPNDPNRAYPRASVETETRTYPAIYEYNAFYDTAIDEKNNPTGIPYLAVMTLRNLARNIPKAIDASKKIPETVKHMQPPATANQGLLPSVVQMRELFRPIRRQLFHVIAFNRVLADLAYDLVLLLERGMQSKDDLSAQESPV